MGDIYLVKAGRFARPVFLWYNFNAMDRRTFAKKLSSLSKPAVARLIAAAGLKNRDERILLFWYVDEKCIYQIAADEHLQKESAYNAIAAARNKLFIIIKEQASLLKNIEDIIEYLTSI